MSYSPLLEAWQSDHLFLLVGTNPLPNYVAARLLTKPGAYLHLFASQHDGGQGGTIGVAENILRGLPDRIGRINGLTDVSNARQIDREMQKYVQGLGIPTGSRVGLNYTGGTKPMSVHTHEILQQWCGGRGLDYQFSYLDPRHISFRFANGVEVEIAPEDCRLTLNELVALHGWEVQSADSEPLLPDLCRQLALELGSNLDRLKEWRQWCDWNIRTWTSRNQWAAVDWPGFRAAGKAPEFVSWVEEDKENLRAVETLIQWVQSNSLQSKKRELEDVRPHPILSSAATLADVLAELESDADWPDNRKKFGRFSAFLDGFWLENYVLDCIQNARNKFEEANKEKYHPVQEAYRGVRVIRVGLHSAHFELDVAALKGYQLFAISCTTSVERDQNKKRLFEAYTRARQLGGDEARVALVGGCDNTDSLLREVNEEWLAPQDVIRVFGPQDWPDLETKLAEWFNRKLARTTQPM